MLSPPSKPLLAKKPSKQLQLLREKAGELNRREALLRQKGEQVSADDAFWAEKKLEVKKRESHTRSHTDKYLTMAE